MLEKELWITQEGMNFLIDSEDIVEMGYVGDSCVKIEVPTDKITADKLEAMNKTVGEINSFDIEGLIQEIISQYLPKMEMKGIEALDEFIDLDNSLIYDPSNGLFFLADDRLDTASVYEWLEGTNTERVISNDDYPLQSRTKLTIEDEYISLDEWDGQNLTTGGVGLHQKVYKILTINGDGAEEQYLIMLLTEWQEDHAEGKIVDDNSLITHLISIDRDPNEYWNEIREM